MTNLQNHRGILINGQADANLSVTDRGLAYGDGVYRTFMVQHGEPLLWPSQYHKLQQDAAILELSVCSSERLLAEIQTVAEHAARCVVKVIITRGSGSRGYAIPAQASHNRIVIKSEYPSYPDDLLVHGARLFLCKLRLSQQVKLAGIKHLNRLENVLARSESDDPSFQDGLLLDQQGNVVECTSGNIFARFNDQLITPKLNECGVAGVVRDWVMQQSPHWSLHAQEATLSLSQLAQADEVLMTNSVAGAINIVQLQDKTWQANNLAKQIRKVLGIAS